MSWFLLIIAGLLEVAWSLGLKYTEGFTRLVPSLLTGLTIVLSMYLLAKATEVIPIGTAYPIWVGIGAVGAAIGGVVLFKEPVTLIRLMFLLLLIVSIVGLKLSGKN